MLGTAEEPETSEDSTKIVSTQIITERQLKRQQFRPHHVEQHDTRERECKESYTIGDATDIAVQKASHLVHQHEFQVEGDVDEQGQEKHQRQMMNEDSKMRAKKQPRWSPQDS